MLKKANFSSDDFLYILGDIIDRNGDGGVGILLWLLEQVNVQLILGNHEAMLLSCDFVFDEITEDSINAISSEKIELLNNYMLNGGNATLKALRNLPKNTQQDILDYLRDCPLYEAVTASEKDFILVHSGFNNFNKNKKSEITHQMTYYGRGLNLRINIMTILQQFSVTLRHLVTVKNIKAKL